MKSVASKLDQFAEVLMDMDREKKTLAEMQAFLDGEGAHVANSTLSRFLEARRQADLQSRLLAQISAGAQQCKAVEKQFGSNPAPELETLVKLHRVLILQLSTTGVADPELLKLADQLLRTAMEFVNAQTKANQKERELALDTRRLALLEEKAKQAQQAKDILAAVQNQGGISPETLAQIEEAAKLL